MSISVHRSGRVATGPDPRLPLPAHVYRLSVALAVVSAVTAALTFFRSGILTGPAVMNGSARGTALVMMVLAVPLLLVTLWLAGRGSVRAVVGWLGALMYLLYNSFLLLFATPFNQLFLLYVVTFALAVLSVGALLRAFDAHQLVDELPTLPARALACVVWIVVALNAMAWLRVVVPALVADDPRSFLDGTGIATNPIYVQDLGFWLPLMAVAAWWLWRREPWGVLLTGSWLVFGVMEGIGIAVDQWFGHRADPSSPLASTEVIPAMLVLTLVLLVPLYFYFRRAPRVSKHASG